MLMIITVKPDDEQRTQNEHFFLVAKVGVFRSNEGENLYACEYFLGIVVRNSRLLYMKMPVHIRAMEQK